MKAFDHFNPGETIFRHGDVMLKLPTDKPKGKTVKGSLLHKGQNHHHTLRGGSFKIIQGDKKYLKVDKKTKLTHEEHGPIEIPKGVYLVDIQVEYDHFLEESRQVVD